MTQLPRLRSTPALQAAARFCCAAFMAMGAGSAIAHAAPALPPAAEAAAVLAFRPTGIESGINAAVHEFMQLPRLRGMPESDVRDHATLRRESESET